MSIFKSKVAFLKFFLVVTYLMSFYVFLGTSLALAGGGGGGEGGGMGSVSPVGRDDAISSMASTVGIGMSVSVGKGMGTVAEAVADEASSRGIAGVSVSETADGYSVSASGGGEGGSDGTRPSRPPFLSAGCELNASRTTINPGQLVTFTWDVDIEKLACTPGEVNNCGNIVSTVFDREDITSDSVTVNPTSTRTYGLLVRYGTGYSEPDRGQPSEKLYSTAICLNTVTVVNGDITDLIAHNTTPTNGSDVSTTDGTVSFTGFIRNEGPEVLSSSTRTVLEIDEDFDDLPDRTATATVATFTTLTPGSTAVVSHSLDSMAPGHYQYRFRADADYEVIEANESNNAADWYSIRVIDPNSCWVANPDKTPRMCSEICSFVDGGIPHPTDPLQCISGEKPARPAAAYNADGTLSNGIQFLWGADGSKDPNYRVTETFPGTERWYEDKEPGGYVYSRYKITGPEYCYAPGQKQDGNKADLIIGCNCRVADPASCGTEVPPLPECSNGEDDDGDGLIDFDAPEGEEPDPGCKSPTDDDETDTVVTISAEPPVVDVGDTTKLTWNIKGDESCTITEQVKDRTPRNWRSGLTGNGSSASSELIRNTVFTLDCGTLGKDSVTIRVNLPLSITADPVLIRKSDPSTVSWQNDIRTNSSERSLVICSITPAADFAGADLLSSGSRDVYPEHEVRYEYKCTFPSGWFRGVGTSGRDSVRVQVLPEMWET